MLHIRGLTKSFGPRRAVSDIDLDVAAGEIVVLVGENGAGKSTLVKCIAGALTPDEGEVTVDGGGQVGVIWQDLELCDNLDAVANIFLGAERKKLILDEEAMRRGTRQIFAEIGVQLDDLSVPVGQLSGGQRQMVAVARVLRAEPAVLLLDEPTAALGVTETRALEELMRRLRRRGLALLTVSHRIEQVFALADRIVVMRQGRIVSILSPSEVHPDDVVAIMSGAATDSIARRQLHQLRRLVDELAEVEPAASLPLILTSLERVLSTGAIGLWLVAEDGGLAIRADVGLSPSTRSRLLRLPRGEAGGVIGLADFGKPVVIEDATDDPWLGGLAASAWSVPVPGTNGILGVIAGLGQRSGRPGVDQLELVELHANLAAVAIERESLLSELRRRNHLLESLRGLLDRLAGPETVEAGVGIALLPLCQAVEADAVALYERTGTELVQRAIAIDGSLPGAHDLAFADAATLMSSMPPFGDRLHRAQLLADGVVGVMIADGDRWTLLAARWIDPQLVNDAALDLLQDAARSLALALEREVAEEAVRESDALRQANTIRRDFLHRLSHELRTPLTAIRGYADTLRQPDVEWDAATHHRFLDRISTESARMGRLVGDLLDVAALEGRQLRLQRDWCDLSLVIDEAIACVFADQACVETSVAVGLPAVWADHDRVEQVLVNLLENAERHGRPPVRVCAEVGAPADFVRISIGDGGDGFPADLSSDPFEPHVRVGAGSGAGLGLPIARGIAEAHGGGVDLDRDAPNTRVVLWLPIEPPFDTDLEDVE